MTSSAVAASTAVTISASYAGTSQNAALTVNPPGGLAAFICVPNKLRSYGTSTCTVTLTGPAPAGGTAITVSSSTSLLSVPASITVPAGASSKTFTVKAGKIPSLRGATVTVRLGGTAMSAKLTLSH